MKAVVRAWEANLNAGNNAAEARLFSLPALISQTEGPYGCYCLTPAEVAQWHTQLLCSAKIVSIKVRGRYATAVFRLGDRETSKCDSPLGSLTAVRFTIVRGKITVWKQMWWMPRGESRAERPGAWITAGSGKSASRTGLTYVSATAARSLDAGSLLGTAAETHLQRRSCGRPSPARRLRI